MIDLVLRMEKIKEISVFFPAYNIENYISGTVKKAYEFIPKIAENFEIIVIEDGSTDNTFKVLEDLKKKYGDLKIIRHKKNSGYGAALKSGFYGAKYSWIAFTDGDGQFDISDLGKLLEKQRDTNADIVIGYYLKRKVSSFTIFTSKIWESVVGILFGLRVKDIDCGFKLISKRVIDEVPHLEAERGAFISSELLIKAKRESFKIEEVGVSHFSREKDKGTGRNINVIVKSFIDLFALWRKLK